MGLMGLPVPLITGPSERSRFTLLPGICDVCNVIIPYHYPRPRACSAAGGAVPHTPTRPAPT